MALLIAVLAPGAAHAGTESNTTEPYIPPKNVKLYTIGTDLVHPYKPATQLRDILVVYPPGYDDPANAQVRYPVIYLLHGSPGNPWNFVKIGKWQDETARLIDEKLIIPPILVAPDGNYAYEKHGDSEWLNSADGRDKFMDYVCKDVVGWADSHLRTIPAPSARTIGGVSEGAYGAVNIALRHPEVFGNVLALSGYYYNDGSGWARPVMGSDPKFLTDSSPLSYLAEDEQSLSPDWRRIRFFLGAGDDENRYTNETEVLYALLTKKGVDVHMQILKGKHGWVLWNQLFAEGTNILLAPATNTLPVPNEATKPPMPGTSVTATDPAHGLDLVTP